MVNKIEEKNIKNLIVKQDIHWHIVAAYLENIENFCILFKDKEFEEIFNNMRDYVEEKINVPNDIADKYVVVEYEDNP